MNSLTNILLSFTRMFKFDFKYYLKCGALTTTILLLSACSDGMSEQQMLTNAKTYLEANKINAAAIELRNILQENGNNAEARFILGTIQLKYDYLASAEKEFEHAALAGWDDEQTQLELARVLIDSRKYQKLIDNIKIKGNWSPSARANITALRALAEANLDQTAQAITTLRESETFDADAFQVLKTTVSFQLTSTLSGDASATLKKALSLFPGNTELLLLHATLDMQNSNKSGAARTYETVIADDKAGILTRIGRKARIALAQIQITEKKYDQADETLKPLLITDARDPVANYLSSLLAYSKGDYSKAEMHMRKLFNLVPDDNQSQELMGNIKFYMQDFDQAAHHLTASLSQGHGGLQIYKLLARTHIALNNPVEARMAIDKALSINSDDPEVLAILGQLNVSQGNTTEGIRTLEQAIKLNPENRALYRQLAIAYIAADKTEIAFVQINHFQRLSKDTEEAQKLSIRAYLQSGDTAKAIAIAEELLAANPDDPEILSLNGDLHTANNTYPQARIYYNRAIQLQKDLSPAVMGLAQLEEKTENFDRAIDLYNSLLAENSKNIEPMLALAGLTAGQKRTNEMLGWLKKARDAAPTDFRPRAILANYYLRIPEFKAANKYIQEAIKIAPEQTDLLFLHSRILMAQGRYREAAAPLQKLVDKLPGSIDARLLIGEAQLNLQMNASARGHLLTVLRTQKDNINALILLAEIELADRDYKKSQGYALRLQTVQPENYIGYQQEGEALLADGKFNKALSAFNKASQRQQSAELVRLTFAASRQVMDFDESIKPLLNWLTDHPEDDTTRFSLAFAYLDTDRNQMAITTYEKILERNPDDSMLLNNLAWLYFLEDGPAKSLDLAERAYRLSPKDAGVIDTYGWILVQQDQIKKGQRLLKLAMDKRPGNAEIQFHYAAALIKSGDIDKGRQILMLLLNNDKPFDGRSDAEKLLASTDPG